MSKSKLGRFAVLSALLIAHTPVLADDTPDLKAYKRYVVGMHSFLCGATDCRDIHVLVVPHEADWSGTSAGQLRLNTLVDNVPVDSILWQASEDTFSSRYQKFSDNIDYKPRDVSAADQAASDTAQKDYIRLQTRYASSFKANTPSWNLFNAGQGALPEPQRKNRNQWADEFAPNESAARDQKVAAQQKRDSAIQRIYTGQVGEWLKKAKSPSLINAGDDAGNQREIYPFLVGDSLSTWIQNSSEALKGDDWQPQQTLTVTSSINTVEFEQKSGGLTLGVQIGYFGADLQGKRMSFSRHLTSSNATFQLAFGRLKEFAITPGNWYQPGLATQFGPTGPFFFPSTTPYFGKQGLMPRRVYSLIAVYKPALIVELDDSDLREVQTVQSAGGGISVGPFRIGGNGGKLKYNKVTGSNTNQYRIYDDSDIPYVIAVKTVDF